MKTNATKIFTWAMVCTVFIGAAGYAIHRWTRPYGFSRVTDPEMRARLIANGHTADFINETADKLTNIPPKDILVSGFVTSGAKTGDTQFILMGPAKIDGSIFANQQAVNAKANKVIFYAVDSSAGTATVISAAKAEATLTRNQKLTFYIDAKRAESGGGITVHHINGQDVLRELKITPTEKEITGATRMSEEVWQLLDTTQLRIVR